MEEGECMSRVKARLACPLAPIKKREGDEEDEEGVQFSSALQRISHLNKLNDLSLSPISTS